MSMEISFHFCFFYTQHREIVQIPILPNLIWRWTWRIAVLPDVINEADNMAWNCIAWMAHIDIVRGQVHVPIPWIFNETPP